MCMCLTPRTTGNDLNEHELCLSESEVDPEKRNLRVILIMLPWVKREEGPTYDENKKD